MKPTKPDPVTKLAKELFDVQRRYWKEYGCESYSWRDCIKELRGSWKVIARHVLTHYARLTPDARRLLRRVRGK